MKNINNSLVKYFTGEKIASSSTSMNAMLRNTISLTMINSGYKTNIIPEKASASLDIRLLPDTSPDDFILSLKNIINDPRVVIVPKRVPTNNFISSWDTNFYKVLSNELIKEQPDVVVIPFMTIGGTDSQFFQSKGVDCYGILPVLVSESDIQTMHGIDERLSIENLMLGTRVVYNTIKNVCAIN